MKNTYLTLGSTFLIAFISMQSWEVQAAESKWREQFDQGLMQEEVHQDLDKAVAHYQSVVNAFDEQRSVIAMSVYRLAECLRKLGRMDEAAPLYARIIKEFPDQESIALLSQRFVPTATPIPKVVESDTKIIDYPASLKLLIQQLRDSAPEVALRTLRSATGDKLAGTLSTRYRIAKTEIAQLRVKYLDRWPGVVEKQAEIASLEDQVKAHVQLAIKNLELRLVALESTKTPKEEEQSTITQRLTDDPRTLRLLIEELEKAPTEVAMQLLVQETDQKIPAQLESEKTAVQLELVEKRQTYGEKHPEIEAFKAKFASIREQEAVAVKNSIQQLKIKLRVLERVDSLPKALPN